MKVDSSGWYPRTVGLSLLVAACSGSGTATSPGSAGSGGYGVAGMSTDGTDQTSITGGNSSAPITTADSANGGTSAALGGSLATGGKATSSTSGHTGGVATGGASTSGMRSGGAPASGGVATGGTRAGGAAASGGAGTGGAASGGARTGGAAASGGARSGGTSSVASSGGARTGGAPATGGGSHVSTPSTGCSVASPATGTAIDRTLNVGAQAREYRLSVPTDYVAGEALPLIFVFNGVGGTGPQAQQFFQVETGHRAIFVYPTSLPNSEAGGAIAWDFDLSGVDVPFFDAMMTYVTENYCIDTSRVFALGASSGGIMSNMLGCFRGDVLRAIAPSSGMTWQQSGCKGDVAVMVICGTQDTYNPCGDAKNGALSETNVWSAQNGCSSQKVQSATWSICQEFEQCQKAPLLICEHPGGHGWPTSNGDFWWQFFMSLG